MKSKNPQPIQKTFCASPFTLGSFGLVAGASFDLEVVIDNCANSLTNQLIVSKSPLRVDVVCLVIDLEDALGLLS